MMPLSVSELLNKQIPCQSVTVTCVDLIIFVVSNNAEYHLPHPKREERAD